MTLQVLYVYKPTHFTVLSGSIEPIVLQSGQNGSVLHTPEHAVLEPGVYRMPEHVRFEARGTSPDHFVAVPGDDKDNPHSRLQPLLMSFKHLSADEVRQKIKFATDGQGGTAELPPNPDKSDKPDKPDKN